MKKWEAGAVRIKSRKVTRRLVAKKELTVNQQVTPDTMMNTVNFFLFEK